MSDGWSDQLARRSQQRPHQHAILHEQPYPSRADESAGRPLRICHLGKYYPPAPGGIEMHVQTLARAQARLGPADVQVVCVNHADRRGRDVTWNRYGATGDVTEFDGPVHITRVGRSARFARLDFCPTLPWIIGRINQEPLDVLHLHTPNPTMVLTVAGLLRQDIALVVSHHSDIVRQRLLRWLHEPFERIVYERASAVLTTSPMYIDGSRALQQHEPKVHAVPMGIDVEPFANPSPAALAEAHRLRKRFGDAIWLAVGRCVYYKGFDVAIEALSKVPGVLVIVGHGPLFHELIAHARDLGVRDRVAWCRYAEPDELIGAYLAATALWFPSSGRSEAFGLVQVESMAAGCPVINTDIAGSGVSWVSLHEQTGLTVPVNDADALASAARRLLDEPGLLQRLAEGALRRVRQEFDHATMAARTLAIYRRAVERRAGLVTAAAPLNSRLREWVRRTTGAGDHVVEVIDPRDPRAATSHPTAADLAHARLAPVRGQPLRRD
jgi:glycosyltransferase involved in cell wall biosynthesis